MVHPRLRLVGCTDVTLDCIRMVCESKVSPDAKQLLLESLFEIDTALLLTPPEVRAVKLVCDGDKDSIVIRIYGDDGKLYATRCVKSVFGVKCHPEGVEARAPEEEEEEELL